MRFENVSEITTNKQNGSIKEIKLKVVTFKDLWSKYPNDNIKHINSKTNKDVFSNHCAINVSESLYLNRIKLISFKGVKCYYKCPTGKNVHAIRAQELANWLKKRPFAGCPKVKELKGSNYENYVDGKTGIIFFKDYWQRPGEEGKTRTGDHIDLWDGRGPNKMASYNVFKNFVVNTLGIYREGVWSNKKRSKEVLFWEIK